MADFYSLVSTTQWRIAWLDCLKIAEQQMRAFFAVITDSCYPFKWVLDESALYAKLKGECRPCSLLN